MERWRPIREWEGIYEISDMGRIRRMVGGTSTYAGRIMSPIENGHGYLTVRLRYNGREAKPLIHCLVADAFLGKRPEKYHVNHKDGDTRNPKLSNLEYVTCSENHLHAYRILGRKGRQQFGVANPASKLNDEKVREILRLYRDTQITQNDLAAQFGVTQSMISQIVLGKRWTALV